MQYSGKAFETILITLTAEIRFLQDQHIWSQRSGWHNECNDENHFTAAQLSILASFKIYITQVKIFFFPLKENSSFQFFLMAKKSPKALEIWIAIRVPGTPLSSILKLFSEVLKRKDILGAAQLRN